MATDAAFCGTMISHTEALHKVYMIHSNGCCCSCTLCYIPSEHHYLHRSLTPVFAAGRAPP